MFVWKEIRRMPLANNLDPWQKLPVASEAEVSGVNLADFLVFHI